MRYYELRKLLIRPEYMNPRIYLDYQATTPLDPAVLEAMLPWMVRPSNAHASEHVWGREAEAALESAREQVAAAVNGDPTGIIFTSNATEAANIVLRSFAGSDRTLLISTIEHPCVAETAAACAEVGTNVIYLPVSEEGLVDVEMMADCLAEIDLASIMTVNNEIGTIQPVGTIATLCASAGVLFHTDAAQALGRVPIDMTTGVSFVTLSAHKIYGPQGIGAICADPSLLPRLKPVLSGGGQQRGIRPGTAPVALCVGFGAACELAVRRMEEDAAHCASLCHEFLNQLYLTAGDFILHGSREDRIPHNLNISFPSVLADELLALLPDLGLSTGSACSSGAIAPSRVLTAIGLSEEAVRGAIRVSFGRPTSREEAVRAAEMIGAAVRRLRGGEFAT